MERIEEIKERLELYQSNRNVYDFVDGDKYCEDVSFLLSRLQIAEEALNKIINEKMGGNALKKIKAPE